MVESAGAVVIQSRRTRVTARERTAVAMMATEISARRMIGVPSREV